jgi:hypothetical protein
MLVNRLGFSRRHVDLDNSNFLIRKDYPMVFQAQI